MSDIILEISRAAIAGIIFTYLCLAGRKEAMGQQKGWIYIVVGFGLILFGTVIDISDNFPALDRYVLVGDTAYEAFLEKVVGYLLGFILLAIGFIKWMPTIIALRRTEGKLKESHDEIESMVEERTAELKMANQALTLEIAERLQVEESLRESQERHKEAQRIARLGYWELDLMSNELLWSDDIYRIFEIDPMEFGASYEAFLHVVHPDDREFVHNALTESIRNRTPYDIVHRLLMKDGSIKFVNERCATKYNEEGKPLRSIGTTQDITERKLAEQLIREENRVLEMLSTGHTLQEVLNALNLMIEAQKPDTCSSILLMDKSGKHLRVGSAPNLPEAYNTALDGVAIGPSVGSCGTAAYKDETIITGDIATDPLWRDYRDLALPYGLRACWSVPVHSSQGKVLGTFALYSDRPCRPTEAELALITTAAHFAGIAIERVLAGDALRESRKRYQTLVENSPNAILVHTDGKVVYANPAAMHTFRASGTEDLIGLPILELAHPDSRPLVEKRMRQLLMEGKRAPLIKEKLLRLNGEEFWAEVIGALIDYGGKPAIQVVANDVTERKRAEEALILYQKELQAFTHASRMLLSARNLDDILHAVCSAPQAILDLRLAWVGLIEEGSYDVRPVEVCGVAEKYASEITVRWDDSPEGRGSSGRAVTTGMFQVNNDLENDPAYSLWRERAMEYGFRSTMSVPLVCAKRRVVGVINLYSDTSDFFTMERGRMVQGFANQAATSIENIRLIEGLEDRVAERTAELALASEAAQAANRAKSTFLANMSHELRTPLNSIIGFSEILSKGIAGELTEEQEEYINDVLDSAIHLLSLINDILDLSKVEAGRMELEVSECGVKELLEGAMRMVRAKAMDRRIALTTEIEEGIGDIVADERKIRQVVYNLLANAINAVKGTSKGGKISLQARRLEGDALKEMDGYFPLPSGSRQTESAGEFVEIAVEDTGVGIPDEDQLIIFQPFQQLKSALEAKPEGTGLGLALSRRIVELHGGAIICKSEEGQGSRFSFVIPRLAVESDDKSRGEA